MKRRPQLASAAGTPNARPGALFLSDVPVLEKPLRSLAGRLVVPAASCTYAPAIDVDDLIDVDFDCREFAGDGLYLVEAAADGRVQWMGCRRFARTPAGLVVDDSGRGTWTPLDDALPGPDWRVAGRVLRVFAPKPL